MFTLGFFLFCCSFSEKVFKKKKKKAVWKGNPELSGELYFMCSIHLNCVKGHYEAARCF